MTLPVPARAVPMLGLLCLLAAVESLAAQTARGSLTSATRYLELRPLRRDTVDRALVTPVPGGGFTFEGIPATCEGTRCVITRAADVQHGLSATHDVDLSVWGLGVEGLSATLLLRGRTHLDGEFRPPRSDDELEAMLGYLQLVRGIYRVRAGRQSQLSGLGSSGFDGLEVMVEPTRALRLQVYGGRSLARTVQLPLARAFRAVDERDFVRDRDAYLAGGEVAVETSSGSTAALRYQGEIWSDRAGWISQRALLTGRTLSLSPFVLSASTEYDIGLGRWGTSVIDLQLPLPAVGLRVEGALRRYLPFFEYWTIWGLFSPVPYHEAELRANWSRRSQIAVWSSVAYRRYGAAHTSTFLRPLEGESFRVATGGSLRLRDDVRVSGSVNFEGPVGAFNAGADVGAEWRASPSLGVNIHGVFLQQIEEFRVGAGVVGGGGASVDLRVSDRLSVAGGAELYRQTQQDRPGRADWTQRRGWLSLRLDFGNDPGMAGGKTP